MMFHTNAFNIGFLPVCAVGFLALGRLYGATSALRWLIAFVGSSLFGVGRNVLCGQLQIELSGEQVDHRLEVSD